MLLLVSRAPAQTSVHVTGDASAAYSDNAFGVAEDGPEEEVQTFFFMLTPGALLYHDTPRARYLLSYQRSWAFFLEASDRNEASDLAAAQLSYLISPIQSLTLDLQLAHSSFAGLIVDAASAGASETRVGYAAERVRVDFAQTYLQQLSTSWHFSQSSLFGIMVPIDAQDLEPLRWRLGAELGAEYVDGPDGFGVLAGVTYFRTSALSDALTTPDEDAMLVSGRARWRRDLSLLWASELSGGAGLAISPEQHSVDPLAGASLSYADELLGASLGYTHEQTTSLESFDLFVSDRVALDVTGSLSREQVVQLTGSSSLSHDREILRQAAGDAESVNVWLAEANLGFIPNWFSLHLRYQYLRQFGASGGQRLPNLARHLVMLTAAGMFPERRIEPVPTDEPSRVDRLSGLPAAGAAGTSRDATSSEPGPGRASSPGR